jgi:hypothetical protein
MTKLGVGVGEEFPVDDAKMREAPSQEDGAQTYCGRGWHGHHHGRWHFGWHVLFRLAILGLLIGGVMSFFGWHDLHDPIHAAYPYPHHFFAPVFWIVLLVALVFWRGAWHRHHWHDHPRGDREGN